MLQINQPYTPSTNKQFDIGRQTVRRIDFNLVYKERFK